MLKTITTFIVAVACLVAAPTLAMAGEDGSEINVTEQVLNHHLQSFGEGNVDAILSDYTDSSVVIIPNGVLNGREQIRGLFEALVAEFGQAGTEFELTSSMVEGPLAYITWHAVTADNTYSFATDTFVVTDGKIAYQTVAFVVSPRD